MAQAKSGVILTRGIQEYLSVLDKAVGGSAPVIATSGKRDAREQARAMLAKLRDKGQQELFAVYKNDGMIRALLRLPRTESSWSKYIEEHGHSISRHLVGGAVDLRTRGLSTSQINALKRAVRKTGGRALLEYDHMHVDLPTKYAVMSVAEKGVRTAAKVWLVVMGTGVVAITAALAVRSSRRRRAVAVLPVSRVGARREEA